MRHNNSKSAGPSQRQRRVGEQLRHIVAETLQRGHFHSEILIDAGKLSVTDVVVTPDLKKAKVYVMAVGDADLNALIKALNEEAYSFQKEVNRQSNLKFTPKFHFLEDTSFENSARIEALLRSVETNSED